jgi:cytosine/uracil/thiamine/allantoin permease
LFFFEVPSDADVDKRIRSASAAFGALKTILTNKYIDLKVKGSVYVALYLSILLYGSEIWCLREGLFNRFSHSFTNTLEPCAAQLSPSKLIMVVDFFDGKATSPGCHEPEPKEK